MHFCGFVSNWSIASRIKPQIIQRNVTYLMMSNYLQQYHSIYCHNFLTLSNQTSLYLRNKFDFWDSMNRPKIELIAHIYNLHIEIIYNLGNKTTLYLKYVIVLTVLLEGKMEKWSSQCEHGQSMDKQEAYFARVNQVWLAVKHNTSVPSAY